MRVVIPKERIDYDGSQIASLWAFAAFGVQEDTIVGFRGGCSVGPEHMVDLEDLKKGEEIKSVDMVHFIVEHFDSTDLRLAYHRQRLLVSIAREVLEAQGASVERKGDDLFSEGKNHPYRGSPIRFPADLDFSSEQPDAFPDPDEAKRPGA